MQCGKAIRTDVRLLNLNLLLNTGYRERVFKELDIPALNINPLTSTEDYEKYRAVIIEQFTKNSRKRPVYTATTVTLPYTKTISEKLSLTGLAKRYSVTKADSITVIKKNIEEVYALDYLTVYFANDISVGMMYKLNKNYLTALAALTSYYLQLGDNAKAAHYKNLAHTIALNAEALDEYQLMFGAD